MLRKEHKEDKISGKLSLNLSKAQQFKGSTGRWEELRMKQDVKTVLRKGKELQQILGQRRIPSSSNQIGQEVPASAVLQS